jgi:large subunit ribosomal protein L3
MTTVIYGKKISMGEAYLGNTRHAVTKIALFPMTVSQQKTVEKDGYAATQVAFDKKSKRELASTPDLALKSLIKPEEVVKVGVLCNIQGVSKGKGFSGVVKRWNFAGGPRTHGQSDRLRAPGSIGQGTTPGRVHKGKHMAGHMGHVNTTVKNSCIIAFDPSDSTVWVTGPVPGSRSTLVRLTLTGNRDIETLSFVTGGLKLIAPVAPTETVAETTEA